MSRFTFTTAIAWTLVIVLLWVMLSIDGGNVPWLEMGTTDPPAAVPSDSAARPVATMQAPTCEETENALRDRVDSARYCTVDSDCTLFDFGYPIECMTSVAKSEITELRLEYRKYETSCDFRVYFDCPAEPMERHAVCQENRCAVSLETRDVLEEETLDYLGIGTSGQE